MRKFLIMAIVVLALSPAMLFAQAELKYSPSGQISGFTFTEPADSYLSPYGFGYLENSVFMLQLQPSIAAPASRADFGFGSWFGGLYGSAYYGFNSSTVGNLGSNQSVIQSQDDDLILGGAGGLTVIGKTSVSSNQVRYTVNSLQNPIFLVGFRLGDMVLGIRNDLESNSANEFGTYNNAGTSTASVTTRILDTAGNVTRLVSTEYALGSIMDSSFSDTLQAGITMPLGAITLRAGASFGLTAEDYSTSYAYEVRTVDTIPGYAAYTPTYTLPGITAAAIEDLQDLDVRSYE